MSSTVIAFAGADSVELTQDRAALLDPNTSASLTPDQIDVVLTELSKVHAPTLPAGLAEHDYASPQ